MRSACGKRDLGVPYEFPLCRISKSRLPFHWFPMGTLAAAQCFRKPPFKANVLSSWGYRLDLRHFGPSNFLIDRFSWHFGAVPGLCRRRQSVADQSNQRVAAAATLAAPTKEHAKAFPILIRIFKEESELEVWKQDTTGRFELLKVYPICRWSGDLGPKITEGDRQAPEGFYTITPGLMNPNSNYYLAINTGFPNAYDRANDRHGGFLMIHGDCSSRGCYAMTDEQIGEIYSLARKSFLGGQPSFQIQAYPFRMTPANLARHRTNPHLAFWKMLKIGNDHFEATHLEPKVDVCDKHYVFDAAAAEWIEAHRV